jgi:hypothetical protein
MYEIFSEGTFLDGDFESIDSAVGDIEARQLKHEAENDDLETARS